MCSNYRTVTRADHLLSFFGGERKAHEPLRREHMAAGVSVIAGVIDK